MACWSASWFFYIFCSRVACFCPLGVIVYALSFACTFIMALLLLALLTAIVGGVGPEVYNDALLEQLTIAGDFPNCIGL